MTQKQDQKHCRIIVVGLGNIGRRFLQTVADKTQDLRERYGVTLVVVGAADSRGAVINPAGLNLDKLVGLKKAGKSVVDGGGATGMSALDLVKQVKADVLCEASPVNMESGEPGLSCMYAALDKGMHVVTANKGPLVLAYPELTRRAAKEGRELRFCGTVCGGLPAINLGVRDLAGAMITRLEALPNLTTSFILERMTLGQSYDQALAAAQAQGCAEADPTLDVDGWDAAFKLVILANSVLGVSAKLDDVQVTGITGVSQAELKDAKVEGKVIKLVAAAERQGDRSYTFSVRPTALRADHPLAQLSGQQMGIVYETDIYGTISAAILETEPIPSASSMLRDVLGIYGTQVK